VIDTATLRRIGSIRTGRRPLQMALDAARGRLYVTNFGSGTLSVIGTLGHTLLGTIRVGAKPFGVAVDPASGRVYVTNLGSDTVSIVDGPGNVVVQEVRVGQGPLGIGLDATGEHAYVADGNRGALVVLDTRSGSTVGTHLAGGLPVAFGTFIGARAAACPAPALDCEDHDPFTADTCIAAAGCAHQALGGLDATWAGLDMLAGALAIATPDQVGDAPAPAELAQMVSAARASLGSDGSGLGAVARALGEVRRTLSRALRRDGMDHEIVRRLLDLTRATERAMRRAHG
jgi:YVTN family beta-propeller protein